MKKLTLTLLLTILLISNGFAVKNEEFRATWVITWEHQCDSTIIKQILDNHVAANMNAVLFQVRQGGTAYYRSSFEPWGYYAGYEDPGFDPLEFTVREAHKRGLELHAWFNAFHTSSTIAGSPAAEHPEWVCRDGDGNPMPQYRALSPALEEVREYTLDVIMEIVNKYDIDGMHLDYIRWNEYTTSSVLSKPAGRQEDVLDGQIAERQKELLAAAASPDRYLYDIEHPYSAGVPDGFDSWEDFWRDAVTQFVVSVHDSIQTVKPYVRLSVAALGKYRWSGWQGYESVYQDAALWYNEGYIDQLTPMHYHWTDGSGFYQMLNGVGTTNWDYWLEDDSPVLYTVGPGSYLLNEGNIWHRHEEIVTQSRKVDYVDGFQFFSYGSWEGNEYWEEAGATIFPNKTKIRKNEIYSGDVPASPTISLEKNNDLEYNITLTPNAAESGKLWYVVYRSEDETIEPDNDEIIAIKFTDEVFTIDQAFDGNQTFDGEYTYAATAVNRFWWESELSNLQVSDAIPSTPPVVLDVSPAEGDSIQTNPVLTFEFSKAIDLASFENAFTIEPAAEVVSVSISDEWYNASKVVTVNLSGLEFGTAYTVTLTADLTDLNGVALDGNYDGNPGDPYSIQYVTYSIDVQGPQLLSSTPENNQQDVDPEEVWGLTFDELLDAETIPGNIRIFNKGRELAPELQISDENSKTYVNFKTRSSLQSNSSLEILVSGAITDTAGNEFGEDYYLTADIADYYYSEKVLLDDFTGDSEWWDPEGSGSTIGTVDGKTAFVLSKANYMPGFGNSRSAKIRYKWDESYSDQPLLRAHCASGPAIETVIDTSYTVQCYLFGDGSNNKFRFALYEKDGGQTAEVSRWITIDWTGWKLVEWDLSDPAQVGEWLGNGIFDGGYYQLDGLHMTRGDGGLVEGGIYVDELRLVKKSAGQAPANHAPVLAEFEDATIDQGDYLKLYVNYTDDDENDTHEIIGKADTSAIAFNILGHESGDRVYVVPNSDFTGTSEITIIVKDFGVGELSDTTSFYLSVSATGIDENDFVVTDYSLSQNYPNPFNPETTIDFALPKNGDVKINIYDMRGNLIEQLVNDNFNAGKYHVKFKAAGLASGVYIYQLQTPAKVITKKMMLLK